MPVAVGDFAISASVGKDALSNKSSGKPRSTASVVLTASPTGDRLRERPREDVRGDEGDRDRPRSLDSDDRTSRRLALLNRLVGVVRFEWPLTVYAYGSADPSSKGFVTCDDIPGSHQKHCGRTNNRPARTTFKVIATRGDRLWDMRLFRLVALARAYDDPLPLPVRAGSSSNGSTAVSSNGDTAACPCGDALLNPFFNEDALLICDLPPSLNRTEPLAVRKCLSKSNLS